MSPLLLGLSLALLLISILLECQVLFAFSLVSAITFLTAVGKKVPRLPLILFWLWVNAVLVYLMAGPDENVRGSDLIPGIPESALWMLIGVGIIPMMLWPLVFLLDFKKWMDR